MYYTHTYRRATWQSNQAPIVRSNINGSIRYVYVLYTYILTCYLAIKSGTDSCASAICVCACAIHIHTDVLPVDQAPIDVLQPYVYMCVKHIHTEVLPGDQAPIVRSNINRSICVAEDLHTCVYAYIHANMHAWAHRLF